MEDGAFCFILHAGTFFSPVHRPAEMSTVSYVQLSSRFFDKIVNKRDFHKNFDLRPNFLKHGGNFVE